MTESKGTSPLVWVGIGCLVLVVVGAMAMVGTCVFVGKKVKDTVEEIAENPVTNAAKAFALVNPGVEFVSADEDTEVIVFRNTKTGEEVRVDYSDLKEGRFSISDAEGTTSIEADSSGVEIRGDDGTTRFGAGGAEDVPEWVPRMPGAEMQASYTSVKASEASGAVQVTGRPADEIVEYFRTTLVAAGFEVVRESTAGPVRIVALESAEHGRKIQVTANPDGDGAVVTYTGSP